MTIYNFAMLNVPFANGAISTEIAPFPDWNRGLGVAFEQTEGKPEMKGLNGLFQVLTTSMLYLKQRGISEWDSTLEYPANAFVTEGVRLYKSKRVNTNKRPSTSQLDWDVWASISDISVSTNGNLKKTVASDGGVTLEVPTATDGQRGAVRQATNAEVVNRLNVNAYINPANVGQTFGASLSENGWCRLPNGLILQWGSVVVNAGPVGAAASYGITYPISFTNSVFNITLTKNDAGGGDSFSVLNNPVSNKTGFSFRIADSKGGVITSGSMFWLAIGY